MKFLGVPDEKLKNMWYSKHFKNSLRAVQNCLLKHVSKPIHPCHSSRNYHHDNLDFDSAKLYHWFNAIFHAMKFTFNSKKILPSILLACELVLGGILSIIIVFCSAFSGHLRITIFR